MIMRKWILNCFIAVKIVVIILACGCASAPQVSLDFVSIPYGIKFKEAARIKVTSVPEDKVAEGLALILSKNLRQQKNISVVEENADYWIVLNSNFDFRHDDKKTVQEAPLVYKSKAENEYAGREHIVKKEVNSSSAVIKVHVIVYAIKGLSFLTSFDVVVYDSDLRDEKAQEKNDYMTEFSKQFIAKCNEIFQQSEKKTSLVVVVPSNADETLRKFLLSGNVRAAKDRANEIIQDDFNDFSNDVLSGKYAKERQKLEVKLSNYYLLALAMEMEDCSVSNLDTLQSMHLTILNYTQDPVLLTACPNSLGRIEHKLQTQKTLKQ